MTVVFVHVVRVDYIILKDVYVCIIIHVDVRVYMYTVHVYN